MDFSIGDRVTGKVSGEAGFVKTLRKARAMMAEVKWDSGRVSWLPSEELSAWDKTAPMPARLTGSTAPDYLVNLRKQFPEVHHRPIGREAEKLADQLAALSNRKKNRTRMKAARLIARFEGTVEASYRQKQSARKFASLPDE